MPQTLAGGAGAGGAALLPRRPSSLGVQKPRLSPLRAPPAGAAYGADHPGALKNTSRLSREDVCGAGYSSPPRARSRAAGLSPSSGNLFKDTGLPGSPGGAWSPSSSGAERGSHHRFPTVSVLTRETTNGTASTVATTTGSNSDDELAWTYPKDGVAASPMHGALQAPTVPSTPRVHNTSLRPHSPRTPRATVQLPAGAQGGAANTTTTTGGSVGGTGTATANGTAAPATGTRRALGRRFSGGLASGEFSYRRKATVPQLPRPPSGGSSGASSLRREASNASSARRGGTPSAGSAMSFALNDRIHRLGLVLAVCSVSMECAGAMLRVPDGTPPADTQTFTGASLFLMLALLFTVATTRLFALQLSKRATGVVVVPCVIRVACDVNSLLRTLDRGVHMEHRFPQLAGFAVGGRPLWPYVLSNSDVVADDGGAGGGSRSAGADDAACTWDRGLGWLVALRVVSVLLTFCLPLVVVKLSQKLQPPRPLVRFLVVCVWLSLAVDGVAIPCVALQAVRAHGGACGAAGATSGILSTAALGGVVELAAWTFFLFAAQGAWWAAPQPVGQHSLSPHTGGVTIGHVMKVAPTGGGPRSTTPGPAADAGSRAGLGAGICLLIGACLRCGAEVCQTARVMAVAQCRGTVGGDVVVRPLFAALATAAAAFLLWSLHGVGHAAAQDAKYASEAGLREAEVPDGVLHISGGALTHRAGSPPPTSPRVSPTRAQMMEVSDGMLSSHVD